MIDTGAGQTQFVLTNIHGHGICMNITSKFTDDSEYDLSSKEKRLLHWVNAPIFFDAHFERLKLTPDIITIDLETYSTDDQTITSKPVNSLWNTSVNFYTNFLPEKMTITHLNLSYELSFRCNCLTAYDIYFKEPCGEDEDTCWCDTINAIRSRGEATVDVVITPTKNSINRENAMITLKIKKTNKDKCLNIDAKFIIDEKTFQFKPEISFRRRPSQYYRHRYHRSSDDEYDPEMASLFNSRFDDF
jgi:hypothetical protein